MLSLEDVADLIGAGKDVRVDDAIVDYVLTIAEATRSSGRFLHGMSPRASQGLYRAAQAKALIDGRTCLLSLTDTFQAARGIDATHRESLERYILWIGQSLIDRDLATLTTGRS